MTRRLGPGRLAFAVFIAVVLLAIAQVAWWIIFLTRIAPERSHVVMLVSEGAFFLVALLVGVWIIYGALVDQVRLRRQRATFLSAVTHELKSPLASLRLLLETIAADRVKDPARRRDLVQKMLLDVDRLERLVSDLLRAGQLEAAALPVQRRPLDLAALAREVAAAAEARLLGPADVLRVQAEQPVVVAADRELLRSVIENLLDNAKKYSPGDAAITLHVRTDGGEAVLEVTDRGVGLDEEARAQVFEPFFRAGEEETRPARGTGLGLFLVRGVVSAHGGRCEAESPGPDQGTTVRLRLPLAPAGAEAAA